MRKVPGSSPGAPTFQDKSPDTQMTDFLKLNSQLKKEIADILEKYSLDALLKSYGKLTFKGSYIYDLMAWRDLDLVLQLKNFNHEQVFSLLKEIGLRVNPFKLKIINNLGRERGDRPQGFWIGIEVDQWKIDLWLVDAINAEKEKINTELITNLVKDANKEELIALKYEIAKDPDYHFKFSSVDLYQAFVNANVRTAKEFYSWLKKTGK